MDCEGVAAALLGELALDDCVLDPRVIAIACGLRLRPSPHEPACLVGMEIVYNPRERPTRQAGTIAHELGHFALRRYGEDDDEQAATRVGAALLVPRRPLDAALRRLGWDLPELRGTFSHASHELIARRVLELREGGLIVRDSRRERLITSGFLRDHDERDLRAAARAASESGHSAQIGDARAWAVVEPGFSRALALVPAAD